MLFDGEEPAPRNQSESILGKANPKKAAVIGRLRVLSRMLCVPFAFPAATQKTKLTTLFSHAAGMPFDRRRSLISQTTLTVTYQAANLSMI